MKVTGFSFIRNAVKYDYPIVEAITSVLPICDEFLVAVGDSDDETLALIAGIQSDKIRTIDTVWDDSLRQGGRVLAAETNKAFAAISADTDWCFYIQGDEVVHEKYLDTIRQEMLRWKDDKKVDGLLFGYLHFWGAYKYVGESSRWYRREIRVVRNDKSIYSDKDAQGFRKGNSQKLHVKLIDAHVYHYGWVKPPKTMHDKHKGTSAFWHSDKWIELHIGNREQYDFHKIDALRVFDGTHPAVMLERVKGQDWQFEFDTRKRNYTLKERFKSFVRKTTGYHLWEYRNYKILP